MTLDELEAELAAFDTDLAACGVQTALRVRLCDRARSVAVLGPDDPARSVAVLAYLLDVAGLSEAT